MGLRRARTVLNRQLAISPNWLRCLSLLTGSGSGPLDQIPSETNSGPTAPCCGIACCGRRYGPGSPTWPVRTRRTPDSMRSPDGLRRRGSRMDSCPVESYDSAGQGCRIAVCRSASGCGQIAEPCAACRGVYIFRTDSACNFEPLQALISGYLFHISFYLVHDMFSQCSNRRGPAARSALCTSVSKPQCWHPAPPSRRDPHVQRSGVP